jgi:diguanylate cyclase (GGDEF)-like protein
MSPADLQPPTAAPAEGVLAKLWEQLFARRGEGFALKEAPSGVYIRVNTTLLEWMGLSEARVLGKTDAELFDAATAAALRAADQTVLSQGEALASEHRLAWGSRQRDLRVWRVSHPAGADGRRWIASLWCDTSPERQRDAQLRSALAQIEQEQSANRELRRELADQALRDSASGLYTRGHFEEQLRREVDLSNREHREFSIVYVELDEATLPPQPAAAAAVLAALGRLLRGGTRAMDAACRIDERRFAVLLSGVGLATAHARMESLRRRCATEIVVHDQQEVRFTVAMGVASFPHTAHELADLVAACENALAEAKRRGGNHVTLAAIRFEGAVTDVTRV